MIAGAVSFVKLNTPDSMIGLVLPEISHAARCVFLSTMPSIGWEVPAPVFWKVPAMIPSLLIVSWTNMVGVGPLAWPSWVIAKTPSGIHSGSLVGGMLVAICSAAVVY